MSIKSILCVFSGEVQELNVVSTAFTLTRASHAALRVLHIANPPLSYIDAMGVPSFAQMAYGDGTTMERLEQEERDLSRAAEDYVTDMAERDGVPFHSDGSAYDSVAGQAHATLRVHTAKVADCLPIEARSVDLVICGYDNRSDGYLDTVLTALLQTERPVLALPRNPGSVLSTNGYAKTVVIAWDGSQAASRALREAVPHMLHASEVYLLCIQDADERRDPELEADVIAYLRSHCIAAQWIHAPCGVTPIGEQLLSRAERLEAELLVMGAYGHGHISEMLLGGVTDYVLKHSRIPLLLTH